MPELIEVEEIAEMEPDSEEAGIPVFKATHRSGSYLTFAFLRSIEGVAVYHVHSEQRGDFRRLMDRVVRQFCANNPTQVTFFNVVSELLPGRDLRDVVEGFEEETRVAHEGPHEGDEYQVLVGVWDPTRGDQ